MEIRSSRPIGKLRGAPRILPSLLLCDFGNLQREVEQLEAAGIQALHLDVMDGHFVPNFSYGLTIVSAIRSLTSLPLDVHLMIVEPHKYLEAFRQAGADHLTIHWEASRQVTQDLQSIRASGATAGLAINPKTPVDVLVDYAGLVDLILIMSVEAGFGGQAFQPESLARLRETRDRLGSSVLLEVDGGINTQNIRSCVQAGADLVVVGSSIFAASDYGAAVQNLQSSMLSAS
jgi:ribulose-phosphate 3-epimerase